MVMSGFESDRGSLSTCFNAASGGRCCVRYVLCKFKVVGQSESRLVAGDGIVAMTLIRFPFPRFFAADEVSASTVEDIVVRDFCS
ncbi:MAG: hypothetical protein C4558_06040 [Dehalococcoidia bacterium]|nr:MAG: hypothetical protein C4558_06040 [Dehalococcoidia bacterium]